MAPLSASDAAAGRDRAQESDSAHRARAGVLATVVGVLPTWVKAILGALGSLALLFGLVWLWNQLRAMRLSRQSRALLRDAGILERTLMPSAPERLGPLAFSVATERAGSPSAGGGFHDVFSLGGNRAGIVIGQVSDRLGSPLAQATLLRHRLRAHLELGMPPRSALRRAGTLRRQDPGAGLASATVAVYDGARGALTYSCAGQPPPILLGPATETLAPIPHFSVPLKAGADCGARQTEISLPPNSTACIYSDGIRRLPGSSGAIDMDTLSLVDAQEQPDAAAFLAALRAQSAPLSTDVIVCLLRPAVAACAPPKHVEEFVVGPNDLAASHSFLVACGLLPREAAVLTSTAVGRAEASGQVLLRVSWAADGPDAEVVPYRPDSEWPARRPATVAAVS